MTQELERLVDQQRRHIMLLQDLSEVTAAMSAASTPDEVATAVLTRGLRVLQADAGFLAIADEASGVLRVSRFAGYEALPVQRLELPIGANLPIAHAVRMRTAVFISSNEQLGCDFPGMERVDADDHACASIPLLSSDGERVLGAINLRFDETREFTEFEQRLFTLLGERCAQSMERAARFSDERRMRLEAQQALLASRALDFNDGIVQLLAEAKLATELGRTEQAVAALDRAMSASKQLVASMTTETLSFRRDSLDIEALLRVHAEVSDTADS